MTERGRYRKAPVRGGVGRWLAIPFTALIVLALTPAAAASPPLLKPSGQLDFTYGAAVDSAGGAATGQKPESKLFYTGGSSTEAIRWWLVLGTSGPSPATGVYLWELVDHVWIPRVPLPGADPWAKADTVFDGTMLYVSTRDQASSTAENPRRSDLFELEYLGDGAWGSVAGPYPITTSNVETLTIAKDSSGRLWAAYESGGTIKAGYTAAGGTSFTFLTISQTGVDSDDIASVTAFGGNKIGVFWSDQVSKRELFAWRLDSDPITSNWTIETAYGGGVGGCPTANSDLCADDHVNVKVYGDEVYVAIKTGLDDTPGAPGDPLIVLLRRSADGTWSSFPVTTVSQQATRPITVMSPDQDAIRVWATRNGEVDVWESSLSSPGFTSTVFVPWVKGGDSNNATSTKQVTTSVSGTVVEASVEGLFQAWHNEFLPAATPSPTPTISGFTPTSGLVGTSVTIDGTGFTGASDVRFNGTSAAYTVGSDTQITAVVPSGATDGSISVLTPGGTATSSGSFDVIPPPSISGFSPTWGPVGTSVTIGGSGLMGASGVSFNGASAAYSVVSDTQITATVPAGASTGPISVVTPGGLATSPGGFAVTMTFTPSDDAKIDQKLPNTNFGTATTFTVDNKPVNHGLLKFTVDVGTRSIAGVKLRLYCVDTSPVGGSFFSTETSWAENTVTWNTAPPTVGTSYATLGTVRAGTWVEVDLGALVQGNSTYSLRITTSATNEALYATKEGGGLAPQLVVALGP